MVMRPSGKMTIISPDLSALTSVRVASGLVGSNRCARMWRRKGRTHQVSPIWLLTANAACCGRIVCSSGPSSRLTWLGAMTTRSPEGMFSRPSTSSRKKNWKTMRPKSRRTSVPQARAISAMQAKLSTPSAAKMTPTPMPAACSAATMPPATTM